VLYVDRGEHARDLIPGYAFRKCLRFIFAMVVVNTFIAIGDPDGFDWGVYSNGEVLQNAVIGNKRHNALHVSDW